MAYVCNTFGNYDPSCYSSFIPCCNVPISYDASYQARRFQEVYYAPEPPPQVQVVRQRLPDPPPDVIDRVVIVPQPKKYIYQVVEIPTKPPPIVQQRVVHETPSAPLCGGTYQVQVAHHSAAPSPVLGHSSSTIQVAPSYVQASPSYAQSGYSYVQPSNVYGSPVISI